MPAYEPAVDDPRERIPLFCCTAWPDFGRPTRYEACLITYASLGAAFFFWLLEFVRVFEVGGEGFSAGLLENVCESALDLVSTFAVLVRLYALDALKETDRNVVIEARIGAVLNATMILLFFVFVGFAVYDLAEHQSESQSEVRALTWPAARTVARGGPRALATVGAAAPTALRGTTCRAHRPSSRPSSRCLAPSSIYSSASCSCSEPAHPRPRVPAAAVPPLSRANSSSGSRHRRHSDRVSARAPR